MNARQLIRQSAAQLRAAGVPDPEVDAALLLSHLTGREPLALRLDMDYEPEEPVQVAYQTLLEKRMQRVPLQYLLGNQPFMGRSFYVDARVLIPRPETELLAEKAVAALRGKGPGAKALDLCCGSGCLAITMVLDCPQAQVDAADLSQDALDVTAVNAQRLGAQITRCQGDLWAAVSGRQYDVIVSNPPYIPREDCRSLQQEVQQEPMMALDGGEDGLDFYRRIADGLAQHLLPGGMLLLEIGIGEGEAVAQLLRDAGLIHVEIHNDLNDIDRMVTGQRE